MKPRMLQSLATAASVIGLAAGGALLATAPASATPQAPGAQASGCSGSLIERVPVSGGTSFGSLAVYYNASTGQNCARLNHGSRTWGKSLVTYVYLARCEQKSPGHRCTIANAVHDKGRYRYYAGPVRLRAASHCIFAYGYVTYNGTTHAARTYPAASHCG